MALVEGVLSVNSWTVTQNNNYNVFVDLDSNFVVK